MSLSLKTDLAKKLTKAEVLLIIHEYIKEQNDLSLRKMLDEDNFSKASWSEYQAFQLGFQKALTKIESFIPYPESE